jgi:hypothetical protein
MAGKRHQHHPTCRVDQADVNCAALAVQRLSHDRVYRLAEEIWAASVGVRRSWRRVRVVTTVALSSGLLVGLTAGAGLGWRMAVLTAWAAGGADLLHGSRGEAPRGRGP